MFDLFGGGPPEDWEPIPEAVLAELGDLDVDLPEGLQPVAVGPDCFVEQAAARPLGVETLALVRAVDVEQLTPAGLSIALRRIEELSAHVEAVKSELVAAIAGPAPVTAEGRREDYSAHEVGVATRPCLTNACGGG